MKKFLLPVACTVISFIAQAQVQFWNIADVEEAHWIAARKAEKVSTAALYQTDQHAKRLDAAKPKETMEYNANGQITVRIVNKYDWTSKSWNILTVDSFFYNTENRLIMYKGFSGNQYNPSSETILTYNNKKQQTRQDSYFYRNYLKELDNYSIFEYNAKHLPAKMTVYKPDKTKDYSCTFFYDLNNNLLKTVQKSAYGDKIEEYTWSKKNELESYKELYGTELQKTVTYSYDTDGRRVKKQTATTYKYEDITEFRFNANSKLISNTHLQYSTAGSNPNDYRHEFYEFQYQRY
jgi:hypothetical protein